MAIVILTVIAAVLDPAGQTPPTLAQKLAGEIVVTVVALVGLYLQRARMLASRGSRRIATAIVAICLSACASTVASMHLGATIHAATILTFALLGVAFATLASASVRVWPAAAIMTVGATLIAAMPAHMSVLVSLTAGLTALSVVLAAARGRLYRERAKLDAS